MRGAAILDAAAVDNGNGADPIVVTLTVMSTITPRRRTGVRVGRIASLVLGVTSGAVAVSNLLLYASGWNVLTDGTFGMPSVLALLVNSMQYAPVAAITAVILAGTTRASAESADPPVDVLPPRLPMIVAIISCCLIAAYFVLPALVIVASLIVGAIGMLIRSA